MNSRLISNNNIIGTANKTWDKISGGVNIAANTKTPIITYLRLFMAVCLDKIPILFKPTKIKGN